MTPGTEQAAGERLPGRRSTFPRQWTEWNGPPPEDAHQRAGWALAAIAEGRARRAAGERVAWLRSTTPIEARSQLARHRLATPPTIAARLRLLELHAKACPWLVDA
jgi:hypothetical protein